MLFTYYKKFIYINVYKIYYTLLLIIINILYNIIYYTNFIRLTELESIHFAWKAKGLPVNLQPFRMHTLYIYYIINKYTINYYILL